MAKPGLPKKYAKMGFKKGWAAYKRAKRARGGSKRTSGASHSIQRKSTAAAKSRQPTTRVVYRNKPAAPKRPAAMGRARTVRLLNKKTMDTLMAGGVIGLSALLSTFAMNKIPWVKDQKAWIKALTQGLAGALLMPFFKPVIAKQALTGLITGGAISASLPYMPEGFRFGSGRRFTATELAELQTVGKPVKIVNNGRNRQLGKPVRFGKPVNVSAMGHGKAVYSRGVRNYASY